MPEQLIPPAEDNLQADSQLRSVPIRLSQGTVDSLRALKTSFGVLTYDEAVARLLLMYERSNTPGGNDPVAALARIEAAVHRLVAANEASLRCAMDLERGTLAAQVQLCGVLTAEILKVQSASSPQ